MLRLSRTAVIALVAAAASAALTVALVPIGGPQTSAADAAKARAKSKRAKARHPAGGNVIHLAIAALHPGPLGRPHGRRPRPMGGGPGPMGSGPGPMGGPPPGDQTADDRLARRDALFSAIGDELGKDGDAVGSAVRGAIVERLDKAVENDKLTSDQRDAILEAWDTATPPDRPKGDRQGARHGPRAFGARRGRHRGRCGGPAPARLARQITAFRADVADGLGVSTDDLDTAIDAAGEALRPDGTEEGAGTAQ